MTKDFNNNYQITIRPCGSYRKDTLKAVRKICRNKKIRLALDGGQEGFINIQLAALIQHMDFYGSLSSFDGEYMFSYDDWYVHVYLKKGFGK